MIKINELMLGDLIYFLTDELIAKVTAIDITGSIDVEFIREKISRHSKGYETDVYPILLSEDFLLMNGFTKQFQSADKITYSIQDFSISSDGFNNFWFHTNNDKYIMVDYVHQLQHILKSLNMYDIAENLKIK